MSNERIKQIILRYTENKTVVFNVLESQCSSKEKKNKRFNNVIIGRSIGIPICRPYYFLSFCYHTTMCKRTTYFILVSNLQRDIRQTDTHTVYPVFVALSLHILCITRPTIIYNYITRPVFYPSLTY